MGTHKRLVRTLATLMTVSALALVIAFPASATPSSDGDHTVTICHVTESAGNPYVLLTVDVAAFDGEGNNDHSHHVAKDGRVDVEASDGICPTVGGPTTTSSTTTTIGNT